MIRRPPRSTRTDTLFPYTTLFRSSDLLVINKVDLAPMVDADLEVMRRDAAVKRGDRPTAFMSLREDPAATAVADWLVQVLASSCPGNRTYYAAAQEIMDGIPGIVFAVVCLVRRSAERRVGKEWLITWRPRGAAY